MSTLGKVNDATAAFVLFGLGSGNEEVVDGEKKKKKTLLFSYFGKNKIGENHSGEEEEGLDFCFVNPLPFSLLCTSLLLLACCVPGIRFQPVHPT